MKINEIALIKDEWQDKYAHILTDSMWLFPTSGREKGELVPLGFKCLEIMSEVGFKTKAIIVKDIQGNEVKGKNINLWRYRALANGFFIFKHEYILVMYKNGG